MLGGLCGYRADMGRTGCLYECLTKEVNPQTNTKPNMDPCYKDCRLCVAPSLRSMLGASGIYEFQAWVFTAWGLGSAFSKGTLKQ